MRRSRLVGAAVACAVALASCAKVDRLFEGPAPLDARLSVGVPSEAMTIAAGGDVSTTVTLTRIGDFSGPVALTTEREPDGVTAVLENEQTVGQVTTATLRLRADSTARLGTFGLGLRGHAARVRDAVIQLSITITPPLAYSLGVSTPIVTIASGGIARATTTITRTNYEAPVALSLVGAPGISAVFDESPLRGVSTSFTIAVAPAVSAGRYEVEVRGIGAGTKDRVTSITVVVVSDPLQILIGSGVTAAQAAVGTTEFIVNRAAHLGVVALSAENVPNGVTATIHAPDASSTTGSIVLAIAPTALPGTSRVTIRGRAAGVPDVTADVVLTIAEARIELVSNSLSTDVFQGSASKSTIKVVRTNYTGAIAFTFDGLPSGLLISTLPSHTTADSVVLNVTASAAIEAGTYLVPMRVVPSALANAAALAVTLRVVVRSATNANGNVLLDWSACTPPQWVAGQDGAGPWQQLQPTAGVFRFSVTSGTGGFAFVGIDEPLAVRYMTQAELTQRPLDMCPSTRATKVVRGRGEHSLAGQTWLYALGGGSASSTTVAPDFSIVGVNHGPQDFFGWAPLGNGYRGVIRRNIEIADGQALPEGVNLAGPESFVAAREAFNIAGAVGAGETLRHTMHYLTASTCVSNALYTSGGHGLVPTVFGVPVQFQKPDDFHLVTVTSAGANGFRTSSASFRVLQPRPLTLPPVLNTPTLVQLAAPYKRLQASLGVLPSVYNGSIEFRYADGGRSMSVSASNGYVGNGPVVLSMPDLSAVSEFSSASIIGPASGVVWSLTLDGASAATACVEGRTSVQLKRLGAF